MKAIFKGPLTGWHFTAIIVSFFAVVITVNLIMARYASSTFGGVVVENSYVASQNFNTWLDAAERQKALGWAAKVQRQPDNRIAITLTGVPETGVVVTGVARHPLGRQPDQALRFTAQGKGVFVSDAALAPGRWTLRMKAHEGANQPWRAELDVR